MKLGRVVYVEKKRFRFGKTLRTTASCKETEVELKMVPSEEPNKTN